MKQVFVRGEISNLKQPASGHLYFTVKMNLRCFVLSCFTKQFKNWFCPRRWYECPYHRTNWRIYKSWSLSVLCRTYGTRWRRSALYSIRAIKIAIGKEGLLRKRIKVLPSFPSKVAVVTSKTGAAVRDILTTIHRRMPSVEVIVYPTIVQGEKAAQKLSKTLARLISEMILML